MTPDHKRGQKKGSKLLPQRLLTVSIDTRVKAILAEAVESEVFTLEESKLIAKKARRLQHTAESLTLPDRKIVVLLAPFLEWIAYLIAVHCLIKERLRAEGDNKNRSRRILLDKWFNIVFRVLRRLKKVYPDDERVDLTAADFLLRYGNTKHFDKYIQACILRNPRQLKLWMLLIDRQRQVGSVTAALRLAQRAYRFHPEDEALRETIVNLSVLVTLAQRTVAPSREIAGQQEDDEIKLLDALDEASNDDDLDTHLLHHM